MGSPSAAQTLLKLTPAAITRTITSNAPGSGTSISSTWKASFGSPKRSSRITQAAIVLGSSPGSVLTSDTCCRSIATCSCTSRVGGRGVETAVNPILGSPSPVPRRPRGAARRSGLDGLARGGLGPAVSRGADQPVLEIGLPELGGCGRRRRAPGDRHPCQERPEQRHGGAQAQPVLQGVD